MISSRTSSTQSKLTLGFILGAFGIILMLFGFQITDTTILDYRQLAVISAALMGGFYASILSAIIIGLFRILYFGVNESSIIACLNILLLGSLSGMIVRYRLTYWRRWIALIGAMVIITSASLYYLLGKNSLYIILYFLAVMIFGSIFIAYLKYYLMRANLMEIQLKENEGRYRQLNALKEAVFQSATEVSIIVTDPTGLITLFNKGAEKMLGYAEDEMLGKLTPVNFHLEAEIERRGQELSELAGKEITGFDVLIKWSHRNNSDEREWTYVKKDGSLIIVDLLITPLQYEGELSGYVGIATDITAKKQAENRLIEANHLLQKLSTMDGLTGIANRRAFDERLRLEWKSAFTSQTPIALIIIDIDYFKAYNDTYGHIEGDECLKRVAMIFQRRMIQHGGLAARYGGEEFAVILPGMAIEEAFRTAEILRSDIESACIPHSGSKVHDAVTISAGVTATIPEAADLRLELLLEADTMLYQSKQNGRNRVTAAGITSTSV
ncbi:sensor domain-containing diguanylate cyclase [Paenibacillus nasutitermitis]|nr:diguanylate cyclase [Paenibacillus nasutitermitis]